MTSLVNDNKKSAALMRAAAEAELARHPLVQTPEPLTEALLHELQVHQIELEMQNEALRQAQSALEESRDLYVDLYEFAPVGYLSLTTDGLIARVNLTAVKMLRSERKKLLQRSFAARIIDEDRMRWNQFFLNVKKSDTATSAELTLRGGDGVLFVAQLVGEHSTSGTGETMILISLSDITERKQAEVQLRIAATVFESQQGMIVSDTNKVIISVNKAFTEITGYSRVEAVGQTPRLLQSGRHDASFYTAMWASIDATGSWQGEIWNQRKNGEVYPQWLSVTSVKNGDGKISHYVDVFTDISARKATEQKIERLAFYDPLTNLPNRRLFLDRLQQTLATSVRRGTQTAVLFLDLDEFKNLNDTAGHYTGNNLLEQVAERLEACVREGDTVARMGGDEFVVLLQGLDTVAEEAARQAAAVGEKILSSLTQTYQLGELEHHCTASIGITLVNSQAQLDLDHCLQQADMAMYQAKAAGKNTLRFFEPQMQASVTARVALQADLRLAVAMQQFTLYYQAQVNYDNQVVGVEALVRWHHPERGMVSPAAFIPMAEEMGLILPLGRWVLETACAQLALWAQVPPMADLSIAVNVSARQFLQTDWVNQVLAILEQTGANPHRLKLELTESVLARNVQDIIGKMALLKAQGIGFSLDDFGTGYSSLSYLKLLPMDQLKIDTSFVRDILTDPNDAAIAQMVIALAQTLGLAVIAEGVETEAQRDALENLGCHAYQGYLYSKPLPVDEFEAFMTRRLKSTG